MGLLSFYQTVQHEGKQSKREQEGITVYVSICMEMRNGLNPFPVRKRILDQLILRVIMLTCTSVPTQPQGLLLFGHVINIHPIHTFQSTISDTDEANRNILP